MVYKFLSLELAISCLNTFTLVSGSFLISLLIWQQFKLPFSKIWNPEVKGLAALPAPPECLSQKKSEQAFGDVFLFMFSGMCMQLSSCRGCKQIAGWIKSEAEGQQVGTLAQKWKETNRSPWRGLVSKDFIALVNADGHQVLHQI